MLPFLKRDKEAPAAGLIIKTRAPDEPSESEDKDDPSAAHEACGRAMLDAIKANDAKGMAEAMMDLIEIAEKSPHEEGPHTSKHDYDSQNQKAAKDNE